MQYIRILEDIMLQGFSIAMMAKGHNSGKKQSSMTSVKYDHLQIMETITEKFHQNPLRNVEGVAETRTSVDKMGIIH